MKLTNKQLKQIIKEELSNVLNEMSGGGLDALKPQMDQEEYSFIKNNIMRSQKQLGFYIMGLEEAWNPNRFYAKEGFAGIYWTRLAKPFIYQGYELNQEDVQNAKQAVLENPSVFTPTGLGRAIAIIEFLDKSSGGVQIIDSSVF